MYPGFSQRSDTAKRSVRKGKSYEREIAILLRVLYPDAKRSIGQSREGHEAPDVDGTPFWVECTKGNASILAKTLQAREARNKCKTNLTKYPYRLVLVFAHNQKHGVHTVTLLREEFMDMLSNFVTISENFT